MPAPTYHLHPTAEEEVLEIKRMLLNSHKLGVITREAAHSIFVEKLAKIIMHSRVETTDERMLDVRCSSCGEVHRMKSDVIEYRCKCDWNIIRFSMAEQLHSGRLDSEARQASYQ